MTVHNRVYSVLNGAGREAFLAASAYTAEQIEATLAAAEALEAEQIALGQRAAALLEGMDSIWGWASDEHRALSLLVADGVSAFYLETNKNQTERFPVKSWEKTLGSQRRYLVKLRKAVEWLERQ